MAEAIVKKFAGTTFKRWRVFAIAPEKVDKAEHTFIVDTSATIPANVMESLHNEYLNFSYEVDSIVDLSSDLSQFAPADSQTLDLKSVSVFDEYERLRKEALVPSMLASYLATHFLSANGYLAYSLNFDAFTSK